MCTDHQQFCLTPSPFAKFCALKEKVSNRKIYCVPTFALIFTIDSDMPTADLDLTFLRRVHISREKRLFDRLSVRLYQRGFHWTGFRETGYWGPLRKSVEKVQV
jgi:hypothetical protein